MVKLEAIVLFDAKICGPDFTIVMQGREETYSIVWQSAQGQLRITRAGEVLASWPAAVGARFGYSHTPSNKRLVFELNGGILHRTEAATRRFLINLASVQTSCEVLECIPYEEEHKIEGVWETEAEYLKEIRHGFHRVRAWDKRRAEDTDAESQAERALAIIKFLNDDVPVEVQSKTQGDGGVVTIDIDGNTASISGLCDNVVEYIGYIVYAKWSTPENLWIDFRIRKSIRGACCIKRNVSMYNDLTVDPTAYVTFNDAPPQPALPFIGTTPPHYRSPTMNFVLAALDAAYPNSSPAGTWLAPAELTALPAGQQAAAQQPVVPPPNNPHAGQVKARQIDHQSCTVVFHTFQQYTWFLGWLEGVYPGPIVNSVIDVQYRHHNRAQIAIDHTPRWGFL